MRTANPWISKAPIPSTDSDMAVKSPKATPIAALKDLFSLLELNPALVDADADKAAIELQKAIAKAIEDGQFTVNADAIAEAYQGRHGLMDEIPYFTPALGKKTIAATASELEKHMDKVQELRYEACPKTETAIQNLIDNAVETYLSVIYKLRNLE